MTHLSTTTPTSLTALAVDALLTDSPTAHRDLDLAADRVHAVTQGDGQDTCKRCHSPS